jgi:hypothetical protein
MFEFPYQASWSGAQESSGSPEVTLQNPHLYRVSRVLGDGMLAGTATRDQSRHQSFAVGPLLLQKNAIVQLGVTDEAANRCWIEVGHLGDVSAVVGL